MSNPLDFDPIIEARRQWAANGWEDACDGMAAITSVVRAQQLFLGRIDAVLRPLELTFARYEVLMLLLFSRRGSLPLNKIGARLQVHPTSVTNAVDRLEEQDLIKRVPACERQAHHPGRDLAGGPRARLAGDKSVERGGFLPAWDEPGGPGPADRRPAAVSPSGGGLFRASPGGRRLSQSTSAEMLGGATARGAGAGGVERTTSS